MANNYENAKARRSNDSFFGIPKRVLAHDNFLLLSPHGNKLLIDLGEQYRGKNNGDLCATWSWMKKRGWKSKETLNNSLRELEHYGLLVCTQHGGLNRPSLYALSWRKIDKAQHDSAWSEGDLPGGWDQSKPKFIRSATKRKKKQVRLAGQRGTAGGAIVKTHLLHQ